MLFFWCIWDLVSGKEVISLKLAMLSFEAAVLLTDQLFLSLGLVPAADLEREVVGREAVDQAILVGEPLLGHVDCFGDEHRKGKAQADDEAEEKHHNVCEVNVVGYASQAAGECDVLEVSESVVYEGQQQRTKHKV